MASGGMNPIFGIDICPEGAENLVQAIVKIAAQDYRVALKKLKKNPYNRIAVAEKATVERFFRSEYFEALVPGKVSGDYILRHLQEECL